MAKSAYIVFMLPVAVSVPAAALVMAGILDAGEASPSEVQLVGIPHSHPASEPLVVSATADASFDCGDVYVTVFDQAGAPVVQESYFEQCFADGGLEVPVGEKFSVVLDEGTYVVSVNVLDAAKTKSASAEAVVSVG